MPKPDETPARRCDLEFFRDSERPHNRRRGILRDEVDRLFDLFRTLPEAGPATACPRTRIPSFPALDIVDSYDGDGLLIKLPGLSADGAEVNLKDGILVGSGEKHDAYEENRPEHHLSERRRGSVRCSISRTLDADPPSIETAFSCGVPNLRLPKSSAAPASEKTIPAQEV